MPTRPLCARRWSWRAGWPGGAGAPSRWSWGRCWNWGPRVQDCTRQRRPRSRRPRRTSWPRWARSSPHSRPIAACWASGCSPRRTPRRSGRSSRPPYREMRSCCSRHRAASRWSACCAASPSPRLRGRERALSPARAVREEAHPVQSVQLHHLPRRRRGGDGADRGVRAGTLDHPGAARAQGGAGHPRRGAGESPRQARHADHGGLIIMLATVVPTLLWARLDTRYVLVAVVSTLWMGAIGFMDDYLKVVRGNSQGLVARWKLAGQVSFGLALGIFLVLWPVVPGFATYTQVPLFKYWFLALPWPFYIAFVTFVVTASSNSVNLTDGLDGLATGLTAIVAGAFVVFAYVFGRADWSRFLGLMYLPGAGELAIFCAALMGAALGFLWFNAHPAQVI